MATVFWDTKILKDGTKRYYVRSKVRDVRRSHGSCRTLREAQTLKGEILKSIADGSYFEAPKKKMSLDEFYQVWIKAKSKTLKPGTFADYELTFRLHILPALGKMELSEITPANIQTFVDDLSEKDPVSKRELSPATIHKCYRYLRNCLGNAVDKDLLDKTPCRGVIVPRPRQQHELDILSLDEVGQVLNVAEEPERTLIAVLTYAGLRLGEGLGLKWKDIDFQNQCIRIERTFGQQGWSTPKTRSSRRAVPMSPTLTSWLKDYRKATEHTSSEDVVFTRDGSTPLDQSNVRRDFNSALEKAEIRHVRIHDLRHTYATNMLASGCSIKFLQNSLGHATATMTLNTYAHYIPESGAESVARFDALIKGSVRSIPNRKKR